MKQVLVRSGKVSVEDVPAPEVGDKCVLVRVEHSCLSSGTEATALQSSGTAQYIRSWLHPRRIQKVLGVVQQHGLRRTLSIAKSRIGSMRATGYSVAGTVLEVGERVKHFKVGDRVACAGAGIANHAEIVNVPVNLAVKVPGDLPMREASTVTLGAIALQSIRRARPELGDNVAVLGLGVLGQLAVQMLHANGCRVIAVDIDEYRVDLAVSNGAAHGICAGREDFLKEIGRLTDHVGVDALLLCAATKDNALINSALQSIRKKGKLVIVGDVGLGIERENLYAKEIDVLISTSYGPGRYDPFYEEKGNDYPLAYVRWTENRNMEEYLRLVAAKKVDLSGLFGEPVQVDNAERAFEVISSPGSRQLLVTLSYPEKESKPERKVSIANRKPGADRIRVAVVGAGGFAQAMHLPNLSRLSNRFAIHSIMSRNGVTAKSVAEQYSAQYATTDFDEVVEDSDVDLVMILTRHNLHGGMVLQALKRGKNVFVEKPLALSVEQLDAIREFYEKAVTDVPVLLTGYNRRFSPAIVKVKTLLKGRRTPLIANYRMNGGYIPMSNWVHSEEGGGRNLGEACHIYDLFNYITDATVVDLNVVSISPSSDKWAVNDNFVATMKYSDGSVCTLTYTSLGNTDYPKEKLDVFCDGTVIAMDDYKQVSLTGGRNEGWKSLSWGKGHYEELEQLADAVSGHKPVPISIDQQLAVSYMALEIEKLISVN